MSIGLKRRGAASAGREPGTRWEAAEGEEIAPGRSVLRRLGGGRRYDAYLAWDERLHAAVVAKVVRPHLAADERALAGLAGEWAMLGRLAHPVIVRGFDAELGGARPHLVLQHLEGPRLSTLVRRYGPLPTEQLVPLALELAAALHYLRSEGVVHLDVKPSNTIMGAPPRLIDLSVALLAADAAALRSPIGTDAFMAPEQCDPQGRGPVGPPADVWGLGATLFAAATGERAFGDPVPGATAGPERWPQLRDEGPAVALLPEPMAAPIAACLEREPQLRPTPAALHATLEPVLARLPKPRLSRLRPRP
jgi:serine/threonine protein kinase